MSPRRFRFPILRRAAGAPGGVRIDGQAVKDALVIVVPALLLLILAFVFALRFVKPAPPRHFVMTTGAADGAYHLFATRYRAILARDGVRIDLRPSAGAVENLARLADPASDVDVGLVQGGLPVEGGAVELVSLGAMYYEPVWIFYRGRPRLERISDLEGRRIAMGAPGSGTQAVARQLLAASGVERAVTLDVGGRDAVEALTRRAADAVFLVGSPDAPVIRQVIAMEGVRLMSLANAEAYARRIPFFASLVLPRGVVDLRADIPPENVTLLATTANLVAREDFHPALVFLLLQAASEVHGHAGVLERAREFPSPREAGIPLSAEAERYYKSGKPLLQRFVPFWVANFLERMVVLLLPLLAILIPAMKVVPAVYRWRVGARISRWYGELRRLEAEMAREGDASRAADWSRRLDDIEHGVNLTKVPVGFAAAFYDLRGHLEMVRARLPGRG
jgi:TRAP transporter TAXI family solute receptor